MAQIFCENGSGFAGVGAGLELHTPVFKGKGALGPVFRAWSTPGIKGFGRAVMPDFDRTVFGSMFEGEEWECLWIGGGCQDDAGDSCGCLKIFCGGPPCNDGIVEASLFEGFEVVLF